MARGALSRISSAMGRSAAKPQEIPARAVNLYRYRRRQLGAARRFLRKEFQWETEWSNRKIQWWSKGFLSRSATLYDLESNDPNLYINDFQRYLRTKNMVHPHLQETLNNKFNFFLMMSSLGLESDIVPLLGLHSRGYVYHFPQPLRTAEDEFIHKVLDEHPHIFIKPLHGAEANGVRSLTRQGDDLLVDGKPMEISELLHWMNNYGRPMLFEKAVQQHSFQAAMNPLATNTIRILTMPDTDKNAEPFIVRAVHRIGSSRSGHIDNWTRGGLSANIDLDSGVLSRASQLPEGDTLEWFSKHPDTGAQIAGGTVPYWEETKELVLEAARRLGFLEYIGWDIIISPTGPVILEANINSGMNVLQVHGPLLADDRVLKYYRSRGAVPRKVSR